MKSKRSLFTFDHGQRNGILLLLALIVLVLGMRIYLDNNTSAAEFNLVSAQVEAIRKEMDSIKQIKIEENSRPKYKFNPNFISEYKAYTLGLSAQEYLKLKAFRDEGKWINSVSDFKKVSGVSDSLLKEIATDFKFPDWVNNPRPSGSKYQNNYIYLPEDKKKDLNTASATELQEVPGIGAVLSERIIAFRERQGGFSGTDQLYAIYGLNEAVIDKIKMQFSVKNPKKMLRYNINEVSASDIATLPGISFELAVEIWNFVRVRDGIQDLDELKKIEEITPAKLRLIRLYLFAE